jgi:hypothetical protein
MINNLYIKLKTSS